MPTRMEQKLEKLKVHLDAKLNFKENKFQK